jgi:hypothetical protein
MPETHNGKRQHEEIHRENHPAALRKTDKPRNRFWEG